MAVWPNLLLLTVDYGSAHRRAAEALAAAYQKQYPAGHVAVVNPMRHPAAPSMFRAIERIYLGMLERLPVSYSAIYHATDQPQRGAALVRMLARQLQPAVMAAVHAHPEHAIASTFPCYTTAADQSSPYGLATIVTDPGPPHAIWRSLADDRYTVAHEGVASKLVAAGVLRERIAITGVPIHPRFERRNVELGVARGMLGWPREQKTVVLVGGGAGVGNLHAIAQVLDLARLGLHLVVCAGSNAVLEQRIRADSWRGRVSVYGPLPDLADVMRAADIVVCRAGGLTISEAMALGRPVIIHGASPGQEAGNRFYVCEAGAGVAARTPADVVAAVQHWLQDVCSYQQAAAAARKIGRPHAASAALHAILGSGTPSEAVFAGSAVLG